MLQDLIDEAVLKCFADYDTPQAFGDAVVGILPSKRRATVPLWFLGIPLERQFDDAVKTLEEMNARSGFGVFYVERNGRMLVFIMGINEIEKGLCALEKKSNTMDPPQDLTPIPDISTDPDCVQIAALDWGGSRRRVHVVAATDRVVI